MRTDSRVIILIICLAVIFAVFQTPASAQVQGDITWMADYFPSFSDKATVALWLFDETEYSLNTLTDASIYEYDLRLLGGSLVPGKFGTALKSVPDAEYNLYYAEWMGKVCKVLMRRPKGEPAGVWGPTIAPEKILTAISAGDWTIEFWFKCVAIPKSKAVMLDMGHAYEPGFTISLDPKGTFEFENVYTGYKAACPTDRNILDGKWHHVAFTYSNGKRVLCHYIDGIYQGDPVKTPIDIKPVPETIIPSSFVRPEGYEVFDKTANAPKYRLHRFNLSMAQDRHGDQDIEAMIDEFRISNVIRYFENFDPPGTFSRNYGPNAPKPAKANGPPLLFAPDSPKGTVQLGSRKYVFIDGALLESQNDVKFTCNPPTQRKFLNFHPEKSAWRPSVMDVDGKVLFYAPESYGSDKGNTSFRISEDGVNFDKPNLGLYEFEGSTDNSYVLSHRPMYANFFKDLRPGIALEEKYKMTAWLSNRGVYLYVSPDAIHWRRNETAMLPIISGGDAETYWDDQRGVYCTWLRRDTGHYTNENPGQGRAEVYFQSNDIFKTWPFKKLEKPFFHTFSLPCPTGEGPTYFKENPTGQVYRSRAIKYPWAPDTYVAFPWRFKDDDETRRVDLGVSRDGINWTFFAHEQWYVAPDKWEEVLSMYGLIRRGDDIWQYFDYGGAHGGGKERTYARFTQRLDGFVSLDANKLLGEFVTRPMFFDGKQLELNVAAKGELRVEIQDENGKAFDGFSMSQCDLVRGDSVRQIVTWDGKRNVSSLAGRTVRLRFQMADTKLFALQFTR